MRFTYCTKRQILKHALFVTLLGSIVACQQQEGLSPHAFYTDYTQKTITGKLSFEEDATHFSNRKRSELEPKMLAMMTSSGKTREELTRIYLDFSRGVAKCKKIELESESINGNVATLVYKQTDICGNKSATQELQKVRLVNEDGWKIDNVEISL